MANNVFQGPFTITSAAIVGALGYTPLNKAGDTMTGDLLFTDASYDIGKSGATRPRHLFMSGTLTAGGDLRLAASSLFSFTSRGGLLASADGVLRLTNNAQTGFTRLAFGGVTSAFPALSRSAALLQARLADDSGYAGVEVSYLRAVGGTVAGLPAAATAGAGAVACVADANATTRLAIVAGGGANTVLVYSDGTNWLIA